MLVTEYVWASASDSFEVKKGFSQGKKAGKVAAMRRSGEYMFQMGIFFQIAAE